MIKLAIIGDFDPNKPTHVSTNEAITHVSNSIGTKVSYVSRKILRYVGKFFFSIIYPSRLAEISEIFVPNGHDENGKHIDICLTFGSKKTNWLPYGVFTPTRVIAKVEKEHENVISLLENKILAKGGRLHDNRLERLQMHVDFAD